MRLAIGCEVLEVDRVERLDDARSGQTLRCLFARARLAEINETASFAVRVHRIDHNLATDEFGTWQRICRSPRYCEYDDLAPFRRLVNTHCAGRWTDGLDPRSQGLRTARVAQRNV